MRWGVVLALVIAVLALAWQCGSDKTPQVRERSVAQVARVKRVDRSVRGSIEGTVTDGTAPLAGALVCVETRADLVDPPCVTSGANGAFAFTLAPDRYRLVASLATYRPGRSDEVVLTSGTERVSITLAHGGVEITGTVADLNGGPIARARVFTNDAIVETRDDGSFSVWLAPGAHSITASAQGYAPARDYVHAPARIALFMIPEGTLAGKVVDASTGEPVEGVRVTATGAERSSSATAMTDERGEFRMERLPAGRYSVAAHAERGYGLANGSFVVGVGAQVEGVLVQLYPAALVTAKVLVSSTKQPCAKPAIELRDAPKDRVRHMSRRGDGVLVAEGVLPGTYHVDVSCAGALARAAYPPIVVGTSDVDAELEVDPGASIAGRVRHISGRPIAEATVVASFDQDPSEKYVPPRFRQTDSEGRYEVTGLPAGTLEVSVRVNDRYETDAKERLVIGSNSKTERDFVVDGLEPGSLRGKVVDGSGKPLDQVSVSLDRDEHDPSLDVSRKTDVNGNFAIERLRPGDYVVTARRSWEYQSKEVRSERISVGARQSSSVTIVLDEPTGTITGVVTDASGAPASDVFVKLTATAKASRYDFLFDDATIGRPILTTTDGTFIAPDLPIGTYTVRAYRKGGGDGIATSVPTGGTATIQLRKRGSITGTVRSWNSTLDELTIDVGGRSQRFFRTNGAFVIDDLPAGRHTLTAGAEGKESSVEVTLADGEHKSGVVVELVSLVTIRGRVLDQRSHEPVPKVSVHAQAIGGSTRFSFGTDRDERGNISDERGRFTVKRVALGKVLLRTVAHGYWETFAVRTIAGRDVIDVGDIYAIPRHDGEPGYSGITWTPESDNFENIETAQPVVKSIDANSPAALAGLKPGDVVTQIGGIDMRGFGALNRYFLLDTAPVGTTLAFTLARGMTVSVTLTKRP